MRCPADPTRPRAPPLLGNASDACKKVGRNHPFKTEAGFIVTVVCEIRKALSEASRGKSDLASRYAGRKPNSKRQVPNGPNYEAACATGDFSRPGSVRSGPQSSLDCRVVQASVHWERPRLVRVLGGGAEAGAEVFALVTSNILATKVSGLLSHDSRLYTNQLFSIGEGCHRQRQAHGDWRSALSSVTSVLSTLWVARRVCRRARWHDARFPGCISSIRRSQGLYRRMLSTSSRHGTRRTEPVYLSDDMEICAA
jgi:hypothetical protein